MAYFDRDEYLRIWLLEALADEVPAGPRVYLRAAEPEPGAGDADSPRGFIIRDWFGPFLLSPASRHLRGRC